MPGKVPLTNQFKHLPDLQRETPDDPFSLFYFSLDWYPTLELMVGPRTDWANAWTRPPISTLVLECRRRKHLYEILPPIFQVC